MNVQRLNYFQQVKASGRAIAFLGLLLGLTAGVFTGVGLKHLCLLYTSPSPRDA